jgi:beta-N-acetylhexosaminidase
MEALLRDISPGGIMLFKMNLALDKERIPGFLQTVSDLAAEGTGGIRPFMAVDHEGGLVHRFGDGVERLPPPLSFWDSVQSNGREAALQRIEEGAGRSGKELKSLGINLNLAPVAEILNDENQRFLEDRSYGRDGDFVAAAAVAFIRGMDAAGIACAVKHFPGNSSADPHSAQAVLTADRETLDRMVRPFGDIIREVNPAGVMVSHVIVDAWEPGVHASRSPAVISGWLRDGLGYRGIILGDDFSMGAISAAGLREEEAIVDALNAGVDMVMTWPRNLARVHRSILKALDEGRITRKRLEEASARILYEKIRYGLAD